MPKKEEKINEKIREDLLFSRIMGSLSIIFAFFNPVAGIIIGLMGIYKIKELNTENAKEIRKLNIIGVLIGIIMIILSLITFFYYLKKHPEYSSLFLS